MSRFRKEYRELTAEEKIQLEDIKTQAEVLEQAMAKIPGRYSALAMAALEQSVMWAVKGITE